jgi:hypothetical protein
LKALALRAKELIGELEYEGDYTHPVTANVGMGGRPVVIGEETVPLAEIQTRQLAHLAQFADVVETLHTITQKELALECLAASEVEFLRGLIEKVGRLPAGCGGVPKFDGWYPGMFYRKYGQPETAQFHADHGADADDRVVADVHTDVPSDASCGSPGHVLHEGVGRVHLLMIAVDNGGDRMVVAGPVLSHYEFALVGPPKRLTNSEWRNDYEWRASPNEWTRDYLVGHQD